MISVLYGFGKAYGSSILQQATISKFMFFIKKRFYRLWVYGECALNPRATL
jgi:hypothetical protein